MTPGRLLARVGTAGRRSGFTLLEMLGVMAGLAVVILFGVTIMASAFKLQNANEAAHTQSIQHETFVDLFRQDVARATAAPVSLDKWTAGPACLILETGPGEQIVYVDKDGQLERWRWPKGGVYPLHPGLEDTRMTFSRSGPDNKLVTMRLTPPPVKFGKNHGPLEISAALGGDVR